MTTPPTVQSFLPPDDDIDTRAFDLAYKRWERRRALPAELAWLDKRDALVSERARRRKGAK